MIYAITVIPCLAWALLCHSQGLSIFASLGQAAIILIPGVLIGFVTSYIVDLI